MTLGIQTSAVWALPLGAALGAGLWCIVAAVPRWRAPALQIRVARYIRDVGDPLGTTPWESAGGWPGDAPPTLRGLLRALSDRGGAALGDPAVLARRLGQAGRERSVSEFRARRLAWGLAGLLVGAAAWVALALMGRGFPGLAVLPAVTAMIAVVLCDAELQRAARRRGQRMREELPTVLELLSLSLSAGEGLRDALRRVAASGSGELSAELRRVVFDVDTGSSLTTALRALTERASLPPLTRATDQLVAALERGAPVAEVLHAQAHDAREDFRRALIERAGRAEIAMLFPLVFLILPLSVIYAVFPGVVLLRLGVG
ncbi:type II secretion system F family protein [Microbacterium sp. NPDC078428]|uniref:type II secretion system F family protein n=1 Tax=Microbacterium sp. NPDC078428 TaxID=3364190 RepID=UPI0037C9072F